MFRLGCVGFFICTVFSFSIAFALEESPKPPSRPAAVAELAAPTVLKEALFPPARPKAIEKQAVKIKQQIKAGSVCGDIRLQGKAIGTKSGRLSSCKVPDAVQLTSVGGIKLTQRAVVDCTTAKAFAKWVDNSLKPTARKNGKSVSKIQIIGHFSCRTRNGQPGAKLSEHAKGRALDIAGFEFTDGSEMTLLKDWRKSRGAQFLKPLHRGACGPFGTVLGPNANKYHQDHFHFDTARYRSGSYCR